MISIPELHELFLKHPRVSTDTRNLPVGCIYFALKGPNFNGNTFALQALKEGAAYAVVDEQVGEDARLIRCKDTLKTLQELATYHRKAMDVHVLAITGSNGKTTTKELTAAVLSRGFETLYTQGNLNNHIGVPLTLLRITEDHDFAVIEMGANHQGEIALLCSIAQPDYGIITNIGKAHLDGFCGPEGVKKGKGEMYGFLKQHDGLIFRSSDQSALDDLAGDYTECVLFGKSEEADYRGSVVNGEGPFLCVEVTEPEYALIPTHLTGDYNFDNVMCAVAVGMHFGIPIEEIHDAIGNYNPDNQRSQVIRKNGLTIVLDAYNANPTSMAAALKNFAQHFSGYRIIALGEMLELGDTSAEEHASIATLAAGCGADRVLLVGPGFALAAAQTGASHFEDSTACAEWLKQSLPESASILIKGSRGSKMEKLLQAFG
ncbi:MAG: UDP-N-acetylmuramoyl-tripeptide--D-alanyl-D-alanine ligase [Bacteroidota bacterium]